VDKTRPVKVNIGERRKPRPEGRPGFLRVDSVHQGNLDAIKGLYHINLVDEVSQFQFIGSLERISERFLLPVLEALIRAFPFTIHGFHADNGSEYINRQVAALLGKLHVEEFTKSRARRTNDNALVESKNGSVVRKHLGYAHIPGRFAQQVNHFTQNVLSPYLNFHRPCFFPTEEIDAKGRVRKRYRYEDMMTPYDKLKSLPNACQYLKPGVSFDQLDAIAYAMSDNDAARHLNEARAELFRSINNTQQPAA
jgi:transposase InsO family protein